ncbi:MAG: SDR family NAD(P)-dependent oxidoreductase [Nostocoides sp.]
MTNSDPFVSLAKDADSLSDQRVWLVTGASGGLGMATVKAALRNGDLVAATSRDAEKLARAVGAPADRFLPLAVTLTDEAAVRAAVRSVIDRFGRIDVLVNNAGYAVLGAVEEISDEQVRANFDINVFAVLNMVRAVLPGMRSRRSGHVVNIASISGSVGGPASGIYSASKAAVLLLSESLADEVGPLGIHVTALCPGGFRTNFLDAGLSARHVGVEIGDYDQVHRVVAGYGQLNGRQGGDPARAGEVIVALSRMGNPPPRLYLGADALSGVERKLHAVSRSVREYEELSLSAGFGE